MEEQTFHDALWWLVSTAADLQGYRNHRINITSLLLSHFFKILVQICLYKFFLGYRWLNFSLKFIFFYRLYLTKIFSKMKLNCRQESVIVAVLQCLFVLCSKVDGSSCCTTSSFNESHRQCPCWICNWRNKSIVFLWVCNEMHNWRELSITEHSVKWWWKSCLSAE